MKANPAYRREHSKSPFSSAEESANNSANNGGSLADRRAIHNSVERTRREALNAKFSLLAQTIPSLQHVHRPSKSTIISHCIDMTHEMREVKMENLRLRQELESLGAVRYMNNAGSALSRHSSMSGASSSLSPPILHSTGSMRAPMRKNTLGLPAAPEEYPGDPTMQQATSNIYRHTRGPLAAGLSMYGPSPAEDDMSSSSPYNALHQHAPGLLRLPLGLAVVDRESSREEGVDPESTPVARHAPRLSFSGYSVGEGDVYGMHQQQQQQHALQHVQQQQHQQHDRQHEQQGLHHEAPAGSAYHPQEIDASMQGHVRHGQEPPVFHSQYTSNQLGDYH